MYVTYKNSHTCTHAMRDMPGHLHCSRLSWRSSYPLSLTGSDALSHSLAHTLPNFDKNFFHPRTEDKIILPLLSLVCPRLVVGLHSEQPKGWALAAAPLKCITIMVYQIFNSVQPPLNTLPQKPTANRLHQPQHLQQLHLHPPLRLRSVRRAITKPAISNVGDAKAQPKAQAQPRLALGQTI